MFSLLCEVNFSRLSLRSQPTQIVFCLCRRKLLRCRYSDAEQTVAFSLNVINPVCLELALSMLPKKYM